jgi:hypothetical protein
VAAAAGRLRKGGPDAGHHPPPPARALTHAQRARAPRHALRVCRSKAQQRTLAFCVSTRHADYMADQFNREGVASAAVYAGSALGRAQALEQLTAGNLRVVFSVDLFNEGVDLPSVDTVMMLRPTESKILFLQQLGRGLRRWEGKQHLVVLDFIGNHHSFLQKPLALFDVGATYQALAAFARKVERQAFELPAGCYVNYDLAIIEFLKSLDSAGPKKDYEALRDVLGRRPTLTEFYNSGSSVKAMRQQAGHWFELVRSMKDLTDQESSAALQCEALLREVEVARMTKSFKMVTLAVLAETGDPLSGLPLDELAVRSHAWLRRRARRAALQREGAGSLAGDELQDRHAKFLGRGPRRCLGAAHHHQRLGL